MTKQAERILIWSFDWYSTHTGTDAIVRTDQFHSPNY